MNESVPKPPLGRLEQVEDLRQCWSDEARDFTPWLAQADNITLLGKAIGLELGVEGAEQNVGLFRADILCKDMLTDHFVLIENQLERTDHGHLGQLLTYAAGLDAVTIVWIAQRFTDEHRAALDWLNVITNTTINFFGLEIELWQIGNSPVAPKFNVVSKPNDWTQTVRGGSDRVAVTSAQRLHLEFWTQFQQYMLDRKSDVSVRKPLPESWSIFSVGRTHSWLTAQNDLERGSSLVELTLRGEDAASCSHLLRTQYREQIEGQLGSLDWRELPNRVSKCVSIDHTSNLSDRSTWPSLDAWFAETLEKWSRVFRPILKELSGADYRPTSDAPSLSAGE
jgi:hypothetical protein